MKESSASALTHSVYSYQTGSDCSFVYTSLGSNDLKTDNNKISPFLESLDMPILSSNVKLHNNEAERKIKKSLIFDINNTKVGVIGYLSLDLSIIDIAGKIEYNSEIITLKEEVEKLQSQGVKIIIALGHSNEDTSVEIAKEVEGLDLVINGHANTYLWNGTSAEGPPSHAPLIVTQRSGKKVPVIQSYAYNQYLGQVAAEFDSDGELVKFNVDSILLDTSISQDVAASQLLTKNAQNVKIIHEVVGDTAVVLDGVSCRTEECNFGNLVVDSVIYHHAMRFTGEYWTDASIAVMHSGALATTIAPANRPSPVTLGNLLDALRPESDILVAVTINGAELLELLEHSVSDYRFDDPSGQFLQFSGIRVTYDLAKDPGSRVVNAVVRCWSCYVPEFYTIDDWRSYKIIMPLTLANGGYGYSMLLNKPRETLDYDTVLVTAEFIGHRSPVYPDVAGRVTLLNIEAIPQPTTTPEPDATTTPALDTTTPDPITTDPPTTPDSATAVSSTLTILCITSFIYMFI